jgi:hypothetical protein
MEGDEGGREGRKKLGAREGPGVSEGRCVGLEGLHERQGRESGNERDGQRREDTGERTEDGREMTRAKVWHQL